MSEENRTRGLRPTPAARGHRSRDVELAQGCGWPHGSGVKAARVTGTYNAIRPPSWKGTGRTLRRSSTRPGTCEKRRVSRWPLTRPHPYAAPAGAKASGLRPPGQPSAPGSPSAGGARWFCCLNLAPGTSGRFHTRRSLRTTDAVERSPSAWAVCLPHRRRARKLAFLSWTSPDGTGFENCSEHPPAACFTGLPGTRRPGR